ncbi:MAG: alpha/beta hydrolase-fold protein [Rhodothermales bacterium]
MRTSASGQSYALDITTPPGYTVGQRYPVVYYLDAWWLRDVVRGAYGMAWSAKKAKSALLVGIAAFGDEDAWNRQRNADYTPTSYQPLAPGLVLNVGTVAIDSASTGRAEAFSDFLEAEVFPLIEQQYSGLPMNRGLVGHSFGGLFGLWALQVRPELFANVAMIAPSAWWNKRAWIDEALPARLKQNQTLRGVHLSVGEAENGLMRRPVAQLDEQLSALASGRFRYQYRIYPEADHTAVVPPAVYDSLVWLYGTD